MSGAEIVGRGWGPFTDSLAHLQPLWRFTAAPPDGRLLIYRSADIRHLRRLQQASVCGYISSNTSTLEPAPPEEQEAPGRSEVSPGK